MGVLRSYSKQKGVNIIKGMTIKMYLGLIPELGGTWPRTKLEVERAADPNYQADPGDTKILYEAFDFSSADSGEGFFREFTILVNSGDIRPLLEGELGGQGFRVEVPFFIEGINPASNESVDCLLAYSGCVFAIIPDKMGQYHSVGTPENPLYFTQANGGLQTRVGYDMIMSSENGLTHSFYDADQFGIDITPNP